MTTNEKKGTGKGSPKKPAPKTVRQQLSERKAAGGRAAAYRKGAAKKDSMRAKLGEMKEGRRQAHSPQPKTVSQKRAPAKKKIPKKAAPQVEAAVAALPLDSAPNGTEKNAEQPEREESGISSGAAGEKESFKEEKRKSSKSTAASSEKKKALPSDEADVGVVGKETAGNDSKKPAAKKKAPAKKKDAKPRDEEILRTDEEISPSIAEEIAAVEPPEKDSKREEPREQEPPERAEPRDSEKPAAVEPPEEPERAIEVEEESTERIPNLIDEEGSPFEAEKPGEPEKTEDPDETADVEEIPSEKAPKEDSKREESKEQEWPERAEPRDSEKPAAAEPPEEPERAVEVEEESPERIPDLIDEEGSPFEAEEAGEPEKTEDPDETADVEEIPSEKASEKDSEREESKEQERPEPSKLDDGKEFPAVVATREKQPFEKEKPAKEKRRRKPIRIFTPFKLLVVAVVLLLFGVVGHLRNRPPEILSITASEEYNDDYTVTVTVKVENAQFNRHFDSWCLLKGDDVTPSADDAEWVRAEGGVCNFDVAGGNFYVFAKDSLGNIGEMKSGDIEINDILAVEIPRGKTYLPHGGTQQLVAEIVALGEMDKTVVWSSSDDAVATVSDEGLVTGHGNGTASITATAVNGLAASTEVLVTDCIIRPSNEYKQFIPAYYYSEEEAELMDQILFSRVADAGGSGTRGAVIAAARFITLEMPYMIPYFYENGRMDAHPGRPVVDGEGRYYHVGLYFSETKFDDIIVSSAGPAIWGAPLTNYQDEGYFTRGQRYPNGLSCSGFVSWAMLNGGIDTGDIGAGDYAQYDNEFSDMGERVPLTVDLIKSGGVKVGDLIGKDGHIAIVVGLDDTHIWIAESYFRGVQTVKFTIDRGVIDCDEYHYIINMDHMYFNGEGVYSNTWE